MVSNVQRARAHAAILYLRQGTGQSHSPAPGNHQKHLLKKSICSLCIEAGQTREKVGH